VRLYLVPNSWKCIQYFQRCNMQTEWLYFPIMSAFYALYSEYTWKRLVQHPETSDISYQAVHFYIPLILANKLLMNWGSIPCFIHSVYSILNSSFSSKLKEFQDCNFESGNERSSRVTDIFIGYRTKVSHVSLIIGSSSGIRCATLLGENLNTRKNNVRIHIQVIRAPKMVAHSPQAN
jgi:hypothetical protein